MVLPQLFLQKKEEEQWQKASVLESLALEEDDGTATTIYFCDNKKQRQKESL